MSDYKQQIFKANPKERLHEISYYAFLHETSTVYNKVLDMCIKREMELEDRG